MFSSDKAVIHGFLRSSTLLLVVFCSIVSATSFQSFSSFPARIEGPKFDFGNIFSSVPVANSCEDERKECISKCSEDNMIFHCSSLLGISSTCKCTSSPLQVASLKQESPHCKFARQQCDLTCGPDASFLCSEEGGAISQSCACSHIYNLQDQTVNQKSLQTVQEDISVATVNQTDTIPVIDSNKASPKQQNSTTEQVIVQTSVSENINDSTIDILSYDNVTSVEQISEVSVIDNKNVTENSVKLIASNHKDEDEDEDEDEDDNLNIIKDVSSQNQDLNIKCTNAKKDCQKNCKNMEIDFDCQVNGLNEAHSCACVSKPALPTQSSNISTPIDASTASPVPSLDVAPETEKLGSQIRPDQQFQNQKECEQAKADCANQCKNLEMDFECQVDGLSVAHSCACVTKSSTSSLTSPSTIPTAVSSELLAPETEVDNEQAIKQIASKQNNVDQKCKEAKDKCQKNYQNFQIDFDCQVDGAAIAQSYACVSIPIKEQANTTSPTLVPISLVQEPIVVPPLPLLSPAQIGANDSSKVELKVANKSSKSKVIYNDIECQLAEQNCAVMCRGMKPEFDCQKVGLTVAQSCACSSANLAQETNDISKQSNNISSSISDIAVTSDTNTILVPMTINAASVDAITTNEDLNIPSNADLVTQQIIVSEDENVYPECEVAKQDCYLQCKNQMADFDCQKIGTNFATSCACASNGVIGNAQNLDTLMMPQPFKQRVMNTLNKQKGL